MSSTSPTLRVAFLGTALLLLLIGLYLFIFAGSVATLPASSRGENAWPWPLGPLAIRFVASLVLSGALALFLVSRRPDAPTLAAVASVLAILSGLLLMHLLRNVGATDWAKPISYIWTGVLVTAFIGSLLLLLRLRRNKTAVSSSIPTPAVSRNIAIFIFFLTGIVGAAMFFFPEFSRERWPWDLANSTNVQLLGAIFLAVSLSSLLSAFQPSWYGYDIFYPTAATFATLALVASFMHWNLFLNKPLTSWIFVAIYIMGAVMGFYPYFRYALNLSSKDASQRSLAHNR